jgi:hypothetical protein
MGFVRGRCGDEKSLRLALYLRRRRLAGGVDDERPSNHRRPSNTKHRATTRIHVIEVVLGAAAPVKYHTVFQIITYCSSFGWNLFFFLNL